MRRLLSVVALVSMLGIGAADLLAQDTSPPANPPSTARPPRQRPQPTEPSKPAENPDEKKDEQPPTDTKPDDKPAEKPADGKAPAKQPGKTPAKPSTKPVTASKPPAAPARPVIQVADVQYSEPGPYVRREKPKDWLMTISVDVQSAQNNLEELQKKEELPDTRLFSFETLSVVYPLPPSTSSAVPDRSTVKALLRLQGVAVTPPAVTILDKQITGQPYQSGVSLIRMDAVNGECRSIGFEVSYESRAYNTVYDEAAAATVKWPKNGWPVVLASTFTPQMFVDYAVIRGVGLEGSRREFGTEELQRWVNEQTQGKPTSVPPATLAKWLAGQMMARLQPSGEGLTFLRTGQLQGIGVVGPELTFRNGRGSDFDIAATMVAAYRMAGLPSRLVIGWDTGTGSNKADDFLEKAKGQKEELKVWVEWALYDEVKGTVNWVPVDLAKMRKQGSKAQAMDRSWKYFGTHDELQGVVPMALHFHPPTTVESYGSPAMWGWMMTPRAPEVGFQALRFRADRPSMTPEQQRKKRDEGKK